MLNLRFPVADIGRVSPYISRGVQADQSEAEILSSDSPRPQHSVHGILLARVSLCVLIHHDGSRSIDTVVRTFRRLIH